MKKYLSLVACALMALTCQAQLVMGDMNGDGKVDMSDVSLCVSTVLGQTPVRTIDPNMTLNEAIAGSWTSSTGFLKFRKDGTTILGTGFTYKYHPLLGQIVVYNAEGECYRVYDVIDLTDNFLVVAKHGTKDYVKYYKGRRVSDIKISQTEMTAHVGDTCQLTADLTPSNAAITTLTWTSSDETVATVSSTGLVTIVGGGMCTITATTQDVSALSATCNIIVPIAVESITLDQTYLTLDVDANYTLTTTILPANATNKALTWSSSNEDVVHVTSKGKVMAVEPGIATITCAAQDSSGVMATCMVRVINPVNANGHDYVDLNLPSGTLWATMNVGANSPTDYGQYYAWGETTPQSGNAYKYSSYKWMEYGKESWANMTKYTLPDGQTEACWYDNGTYVGTTINGTTYKDLQKLLPEDDAAHANWGGDWCMPTRAQLLELKRSCEWKWMWDNVMGVNGYKVTSYSNGNSIFLPCAGCRYSRSLCADGIDGLYWSSELYSGCSGYAWIICFTPTSVFETNSYSRDYGMSVRPVLNTAP